jgi:SMC interacting uncharacterized protein involved in chromosome segregation
MQKVMEKVQMMTVRAIAAALLEQEAVVMNLEESNKNLLKNMMTLGEIRWGLEEKVKDLQKEQENLMDLIQAMKVQRENQIEAISSLSSILEEQEEKVRSLEDENSKLRGLLKKLMDLLQSHQKELHRIASE